MEYDFKRIEKKWQKRWEKEKIFEVKEGKGKKYYILEMLPYPSGSPHMGHAFNYTIGDIIARFKRTQGFNVLHPMGYDSFGLPAENAAIQAKAHPKKFTEESIASFDSQLRLFGFSYDWSRKIEAHKPNYYKWDQWIFLKMFEKNMAYKKKSPVNWCGKCNTVLANEQVHNGKCWRHSDTDVVEKNLDQWFFKITDYADELLEMIEDLDYPQRIKTMQKNWIGKSEGTEIVFNINNEKWNIFTTRPDTIYGVTFMVVSAQHQKLMGLVTKGQKKEVEKFLRKIKTTKQEDVDKLDKEGVFTGSHAINPINSEKIPIYAGNFVLAEYGSGMVMAVPAHDQRDFDFAKKYKLPIKEVIKGGHVKKEAYIGEGILINSKKFDGIKNKEAISKITKFLQTKKLGKKTIQYKLRDWLISRQRFWGTPIPIIYCDKCGIVSVKEKDLPVLLPDKIKFKSASNPLIDYKPFLETKCPKCGEKGRRETDTMDTFVNSSWYFLRYCDAKNDKEIFSKKKAKYWMPIDLYIGGAEHACMHLIYYRFYIKFLRDLGLLDFDEPSKKLFNQGMIHGTDGFVMSKSRGNGVDPIEIANKYGVDVLRFYLVSSASPDKDYSWNDKGMEGSNRFIMKVYDYFKNIQIGKSSKKIESKLNKNLKEFTEDIENFRYNLAIIKLRNLFESFSDKESKKTLEKFLMMLSIFCPHLSEEIWEKIGNKNFISLEKWPKVDESKINESLEKQEQLIEKLIGDINHVSRLINEKENKHVKKVFIYVLPNENKLFQDEKNLIKKRTNFDVEIYSVNDKNKYDPQTKSKKVKPGKPGIYLE